jgi:hypothetical protein
MKDQQYLSKVKIVSVLIFITTCLLLFVLLQDSDAVKTDVHTAPTHQKLSKEKRKETYDLKNSDKTIALDLQTDKSASESPSYKYNANEIYEWIQKYPKSKAKLIEVATSEDPYLNYGLEIKPHTAHEVQQEKFGALRVMALQALNDEEDDSKAKYNNLIEVSKNAKDPVIKKIALSMIESLKEGRDYADDFLKAADQ